MACSETKRVNCNILTRRLLQLSEPGDDVRGSTGTCTADRKRKQLCTSCEAGNDESDNDPVAPPPPPPPPQLPSSVSASICCRTPATSPSYSAVLSVATSSSTTACATVRAAVVIRINGKSSRTSPE
ncbi:hypothetical protein Vretifemale_12493 [Volvox reticuliferus]|uniref:Uncharacterized protein n=1 Tax=Volvox reticuliferus TaxID=1737510 RepID=A0A8J4CJR5_9CHLO|nr:hypothetical protein Vretifemale_12493 [Volvox reticuliferus]